MSDRPSYKKLFTPVGEAVYPHLTGEPDKKFDSAGVFKTNLRLARDEAEDFIETLEEIRDTFAEEARAKDPKLKKFTIADVFEEDLDDEGEETGMVVFKSKMKAHVETKSGKEWDQRPRIFDSANNLLDGETLKLGGGSKIRLQVEAVPYAMASSKQIGVSLRLRAVQIVELVEFGGGSPFDTFEGGEVVEQDSAPADDSPFDEGDASDY